MLLKKLILCILCNIAELLSIIFTVSAATFGWKVFGVILMVTFCLMGIYYFTEAIKATRK